MACHLHTPLLLLFLTVCCQDFAVRAGVQDDPGYPYPSSSSSGKKIRQDGYYGVNEPPPSQNPVRLEDLYLDKYLETQDPKYFEPGRYPGPPREQGPVLNSQDGSPDPAPRIDYIPPSKIIYLLEQANQELSQLCTEDVHAHWAFETDINEATQIRALEAQLVYTETQARVRDSLIKIPLERVRDQRHARAIRMLSVIGIAALPPDQLDRYNRLINDMLAIYNSATTCDYHNPLKCNLRLEPDLANIMAKSRNWDQLQHTWIEWHRKSGQKIRDLYDQIVELSNYAARLNNFTDYTDYLLFPYESETFIGDLNETWEQIRPLYLELHAYVRRKLRDLYGPEKLGREAPLPAHVLGNMWAQSWSNILDITIPYPGKFYPDVTPQMLQQGYTPLSMFRLAEDFFLSLNLSGMPPDVRENSLLVEPLDRQVICQPSAWDFCNKRDFRIKMCARVAQSDLITMHHEMTHIEYFLEYRNLHKVFRDGANPGFHEGLSEAIALFISSPKHLQTLGLMLSAQDDVPHNINYLYSMALQKLPFLAFSLALENWRWDVFRGEVNKDNYNCRWWDYREKIGGIKPPVLRSEKDFDPGSKYHVPANIPYIKLRFPDKESIPSDCLMEKDVSIKQSAGIDSLSGNFSLKKTDSRNWFNFVSTVLQFQVHRALCLAARKEKHTNPTDPFHKCDIFRSTAAGALLARIMSSGSSQRWQELLQQTTGVGRLDGSALREYFAPLEDWLRNENLRTGEKVQWLYDGDYCKYSIETANLQVQGGFYSGASNLNQSWLRVLPICTVVIFGYLKY